jgi:hypothetical protein
MDWRILVFYLEPEVRNKIYLAHAPVNVTDFSIGSINCNPNNADRGRSIIRVT